MEEERTADTLQDSLATGRQAHSVTWKTERKICSECQEPFDARVAYIDDNPRHIPELCPACGTMAAFEERKADALVKLDEVMRLQRERWNAEANCPARFNACSFENFDRKRQPLAFKVMSTWQSPKSVLLSSADVYGVGKTHLACALANRLLVAETPARLTRELYVQLLRCPVHFTTESQLLGSIRATYQEGAGETDEIVCRRLASYHLLIVDDVGKVKPRDLGFLQRVFFRIIDDRYTRNLPMILTTNMSLMDLEAYLGGSCADRLREMCSVQNIVEMRGKSYRVQVGGQR